MNILEQHAWAVLVRRQGRGRAIGAAALAMEIGVSERVARHVVKVLIEAHGCPIASSPHPPAGYYLASDLSDVAQVCDGLKRRALSILRRMAKLKRCSLLELTHQLRLELQETEKSA